MHELHGSRRDAMRALAILPIIIAAPTAASAATGLVCAPSADAAAWDAALAHYQALKGAFDHWYETVCAPATEAAKGLCPPYRITHVAKSGHAAEYVIWPKDFADYDAEPVDMWLFIRPQIEEAKAKYAAYIASPLPDQLCQIKEKADRDLDAVTEAEDALLCLPAPDLAAVAWKLRHYQWLAADCVLEPGQIANVLFDVRRLNGEDVA
ncbi:MULTISPECIES: hypothetical protein [unclassified Sphingobium]|uniref:hypothetical protein n=1 Tax=unclassified Sphingobium TaxID=2611147 RepID=UPI0035A71502